MNYLDIYHRALRDYRKNTVHDKDCDKQRSATAKANEKEDVVTVVQKICHVDMEWVDAIEKGLEHVEKAIREDRQFIRSNGEVVDIEKVRTVSKDSVKHLAEHSDLITRYEEGKDIIPDRLYIVERLNDYAVYENRFLYMLLCYLRDFITLRYNEIVEIEHTYDGAMEMHKNIHLPKRQIDIDVTLKEVKKSDPYLADRSTSKQVIARISDLLKIVHAFLNVPLMQEVSKVPMIKPPVTRTNVLRMNHNFRGALALYEFVSAYNKPGYDVEEKIFTIQPFHIGMADEFAEMVLLSSFLTYKHALNLEGELQEVFEREEVRRHDEDLKKQEAQLKDLKRRIKDAGQTPEEYMVMLERRNRALEADHAALVAAREEIDAMRLAQEALTKENEARAIEIDNLKEQVVRMKNTHEEEIKVLHEEYRGQITRIEEECRAGIAALHTEYQLQIKSLHEEYQEQIATLHSDYRDKMDEVRAECRAQFEMDLAEHDEEMQKMRDEYEREIARLTEESRTELETLTAAHEAAITEMMTEGEETVARLTEQYESQVADLTATLAEMTDRHLAEREAMTADHEANMQEATAYYKEENERLHSALDTATVDLETARRQCVAQQDARRLAEARLAAMRAEAGMESDTDAFTSKEAFEELEHQYRVFKSLFDKEWKRAKRNIRKNTMATYRDAIRAGTDDELLRMIEAALHEGATEEGGKPEEDASEAAEIPEPEEATAPQTMPDVEDAIDTFDTLTADEVPGEEEPVAAFTMTMPEEESDEESVAEDNDSTEKPTQEEE